MKNKIKIAFFDADGTLWYPSKTKRKDNPKWIYQTYPDATEVRANLELIPNVKATLSRMKESGLKMIVLSTSPLLTEEGTIRLKGTLEHFDILKYFDEFYATKDYPDSKGEFISEILQRFKIHPSEALMVGDIYLWDYISAKKAGVCGVLFEHEYDREHYSKINERIKDFSELLEIVGIDSK